MKSEAHIQRRIGLVGWTAIVLSSLTLCAAGLLFYLVVTTEATPPPKGVEVPSDPLLIAQEADDGFSLPLDKATLTGESLAVERRGIGEVIGGWKSENDRISWRLKLKKAGIYEIHFTYSNAVSAGEPAGKIRFACGTQEIIKSIRASGGTQGTVTDREFLKLEPAGEVVLELSAVSIPGGEFMALKKVEITSKLRQRSRR